jgi:outer membrane protein assembly factor BamD
MQKLLPIRNLFLIAFLTAFVGCSHHKDIKLTAEERYEVATKYFNENKYDKAIENFKKLIFEWPGSELVEKSQYFLAKSCLEAKKYEEAETEYDFFIRNFPQSMFIMRAEFELALVYYKESPPYWLDQAMTRNALASFENFILKHPDTELAKEAEKYRTKCIDKLARKDLETAKLYLKLGRPESAKIYLKDIQQRYPETSLMDEVWRLEGRIRKQNPNDE